MKLEFNRFFYKRISFYVNVLLIIVWVQAFLTTNVQLERIICFLFIIFSIIALLRIIFKKK